MKKYGHWLLILGLVGLQTLYVGKTSHQIRFEELSESIRNVYLLKQGLIYDGISSNVGWYGSLLIIYEVFGFHLISAKIFRIVLYLLALLATAALLKKLVKGNKRLILLAIIGLSPTWLYFNSMQTSYGIDLSFFPICLWLILNGFFWFGWMIAMVATMSFPTFIAYLPFIGIVYLIKAKGNWIKAGFKAGFWFVLPLLLVLLYLKQPMQLLYDREANSGIFRGGGGGIQWQLPIIVENLRRGNVHLYNDLFNQASSYYFELNRVEFSHWLTSIGVILVLISSLWLFKLKKFRALTIGFYSLIMISLTVFNLSGWFPGIRRNTAVLVGFYGLLILVWIAKMPKVIKTLGIIGGVIILFHHLKVYKSNLVTLNAESSTIESECFDSVPNSPQKSLNLIVNQVLIDGKIITPLDENNESVCRLREVVPAVLGSCEWNHLNCPQIKIYSSKTRLYINPEYADWKKL